MPRNSFSVSLKPPQYREFLEVCLCIASPGSSPRIGLKYRGLCSTTVAGTSTTVSGQNCLLQPVRFESHSNTRSIACFYKHRIPIISRNIVACLIENVVLCISIQVQSTTRAKCGRRQMQCSDVLHASLSS